MTEPLYIIPEFWWLIVLTLKTSVMLPKVGLWHITWTVDATLPPLLPPSPTKKFTIEPDFAYEVSVCNLQFSAILK